MSLLRDEILHMAAIHDIHDHDFILVDDHDERRRLLLPFSCRNCNLPILSNHTFYKCTTLHVCPIKYLHEFCKRIPSEFQHPCHPNHPLQLQVIDKRYSTRYSTSSCFRCKDEFQTLTQIYVCPECPDFKLDIICACPPGFQIEHGSHPQHPLIPLSQEAVFLCQACGTKHQGRPLSCNLCWFWIDRSCAQLPTTFKAEEYHLEHPLELSYSLPQRFRSQPGDGLRCEICGHPINCEFWVYYCGECDYFAHVRCATSTTEPFMSVFSSARTQVDVDTKDAIHLPLESEFVSIVRHLLEGGNNFCRLKPKGEQVWHRPPDHADSQRCEDIIATQVTNDKSLNQKKNLDCDVCIQPISPPFYSCMDADCNFLLHKTCHELPPRFLKQGDIEYNLGFKGNFFGIFDCSVCHRPCNGAFVFRPLKIGSLWFRQPLVKKMDMKCALLPKYIIHDSHPKHRLILSKRRYIPCPCCLLAGDEHEEYIYRCETCSFNLHQKCALYPLTVRHRYDKHPLQLTYSKKPVHGQQGRHLSDECYCEICEDDVNQRGWFYHCNECDQYFHIACIPALDHLSNIKFGGTITLKHCHPHPLALKRFVLKRPCGHCKERITDGMAFQCKKKECPAFQIHFHCAKSLFGLEDIDGSASARAYFDRALRNDDRTKYSQVPRRFGRTSDDPNVEMRTRVSQLTKKRQTGVSQFQMISTREQESQLTKQLQGRLAHLGELRIPLEVLRIPLEEGRLTDLRELFTGLRELRIPLDGFRILLEGRLTDLRELFTGLREIGFRILLEGRSTGLEELLPDILFEGLRILLEGRLTDLGELLPDLTLLEGRLTDRGELKRGRLTDWGDLLDEDEVARLGELHHMMRMMRMMPPDWEDAEG